MLNHLSVFIKSYRYTLQLKLVTYEGVYIKGLYHLYTSS